MFEFEHERPVLIRTDEFDRLSRQIHRYAALVEEAQQFADECQFLLEELRAQVAEGTNRNIYILTIFSAMFLPATLIAGIWGMNVTGTPFNGSPNSFWEVGTLIVATFALVALVLNRFKFL
jgi:zinc transporter